MPNSVKKLQKFDFDHVIYSFGCIGKPRPRTSSAFTMHSAVQPVSHVRSSPLETPVRLFVSSTGKAGDRLTLTLRLVGSEGSSLQVQPHLQSTLLHLIFIDFMEIVESVGDSS